MIHLLSRSPQNLNSVASNFKISRPAISRHMKILVECGLVRIRQEGRERFCEARLERLSEVEKWMELYRNFWNSKLDALGAHLEKSQPKKSKSKN
jgi:DNA-binding transcriptional ArsR family regulator